MGTTVLAVLRILCLGLAGLSTLFALWGFLMHWDPTRLAWKRWRQTDPLRYERTDPRFLATDLDAQLHVKSAADVDDKRQALIAAFWPDGRLPLEALPADVEKVYSADDWSFLDRFAATCPSVTSRTLWDRVCLTDVYGGMDGLESIDRLRIPVSTGYVAIAAHFRPTHSNGRLVIFHQGLAGTYHDQVGHIRTLLAHGYAVIAFNQPGYGDFEGQVPPFEKSMLRMFVEPVAIAINYARQREDYETIDMIGFSAGSFVTVLTAALDTRIRRSYPVAGVTLADWRRPSESAPPQLDPTLLGTASYLDLFVLGAAGPQRGQLQVFNRFDSCCFDGRRGLLYEETVRDALSTIGDGRFGVLIDESHARHKVSQEAITAILADMEKP